MKNNQIMRHRILSKTSLASSLLATLILIVSSTAAADGPQSYREVVGKSSFKMVAVPGATLQYGNNESAQVNGFYMAETETTAALFREFVDATGYQSQNQHGCHEVKLNATKINHSLNPSNASKADEPVVCVTWQDTQQFITWLNANTTNSPSLNGEYRLPTEAEWILAAKGKEQAEFPAVADQKICHHGNIADRRIDYSAKPVELAVKTTVFSDYVDCVDGVKYLSKVGQYQANTFGLKDMLGNVWEMTQPQSKTKYLAGSSEYLSKNWMLVKGGSFSAGRTRLTAEYRVPFEKSEARNEVGFRLVFAPVATVQNNGGYQPLKI